MTTQMDLAQARVWKTVSVDLFLLEKEGGPVKTEMRTVVYGGRSPLTLGVISRSQTSYLLLAGQQAYAVWDDDIIFVNVSAGWIRWAPSYSKLAAENFEASLGPLAARLGSGTLQPSDDEAHMISLRNAAPLEFFTAGSAGGSQPGPTTIVAASRSASTLRLDVMSDGRKHNAQFWIDLAKNSLVRAMVDSHPMDLTKPFGGVTPGAGR